MGLIGPNGAGKSTTIRILMGLVHQDHGEVRVLGHRMPAEQVAAKWDIGFASEDMRLYEAMTLEWHMGFIRSIYPKWDAAYAQLLLKRFGLRAEQKIKGLSHGQRVKATCFWCWRDVLDCWFSTNRQPASILSRVTRSCAS